MERGLRQGDPLFPISFSHGCGSSSNLYIGNILAASLGCTSDSILFIYLGLLVGKRMRYIDGWNEVVKWVKWDSILVDVKKGGLCGTGIRLLDLFPRLYALDTYKDCKVIDRWGSVNGLWAKTWSWRVLPKGRTSDDISAPTSLIGNLELCSTNSDKWLPMRSNLASRSVSLSSIRCALCNEEEDILDRYLICYPRAQLVWGKDKVSSLKDTTVLESYPLLPTHVTTLAGNALGKSLYANIIGKPGGKKVNVRTLFTSEGNGIDVVNPVDSIRTISERFTNKAYVFFLRKKVAYPIVANYKWHPNENLLKEDVSTALVWVKLCGVPVTAFRKDGLSAIASKLGKLRLLDNDGNPLVPMGIVASDSEVDVRDSYPDNDDYDLYDDDMYENPDLSEHLQCICDDLDITIDFEKRGEEWGTMLRSSPDDWKKNIDILVRWSPYSSEEHLLQQFDHLDDQGTHIIIYNIWEDEEGQLELDFDTDIHDIQIRGARDLKKIEMVKDYPNSRHFLTYRHSFRKITYKPAQPPADGVTKNDKNQMSADVTIGLSKMQKIILTLKDSMYIIKIGSLSHFGGSRMLLEVTGEEL
nr:hypothetical protein [Tanacetum cinerariifolium]